MIIDPTSMTVIEWTDAMAFLLDSPPQKLMREDEWQEWAEDLDVGGEDGLNLPNPWQFTDWREWAMRFNSVSELMG